jgi:hypothetical protein
MGFTFDVVLSKGNSFFLKLADLNAQILLNHLKLEELHKRIERIRCPVSLQKFVIWLKAR